MSASALLNPNTGTLMPQFLPVNPSPHPYVESVNAGVGIAVSGTATAPIVSALPIISYDATPSLAITKGDSNPLGSSSGKVLRCNYSTSSAGNPSWLFLPTPGTLNDTYGLLFSNVGGANTDQVEINFGTPSPTPSQLFSVVPSSSANKVFWITNIGADSWVYWS